MKNFFRILAEEPILVIAVFAGFLFTSLLIVWVLAPVVMEVR